MISPVLMIFYAVNYNFNDFYNAATKFFSLGEN